MLTSIRKILVTVDHEIHVLSKLIGILLVNVANFQTLVNVTNKEDRTIVLILMLPIPVEYSVATMLGINRVTTMPNTMR